MLVQLTLDALDFASAGWYCCLGGEDSRFSCGCWLSLMRRRHVLHSGGVRRLRDGGGECCLVCSSMWRSMRPMLPGG